MAAAKARRPPPEVAKPLATLVVVTVGTGGGGGGKTTSCSRRGVVRTIAKDAVFFFPRSRLGGTHADFRVRGHLRDGHRKAFGTLASPPDRPVRSDALGVGEGETAAPTLSKKWIARPVDIAIPIPSEGSDS